MAGRAKKKCLFEDDVRAMLGMPKVAPTALPSRVGRSLSSAPSHAQPSWAAPPRSWSNGAHMCAVE
jgi:hypothetical protein